MKFRILSALANYFPPFLHHYGKALMMSRWMFYNLIEHYIFESLSFSARGSSVGRAVDCSLQIDIRRSLVRFRSSINFIARYGRVQHFTHCVYPSNIITHPPNSWWHSFKELCISIYRSEKAIDLKSYDKSKYRSLLHF